MREIRELEDQMDHLSEKEIDNNMTRIADDLRQIREENQQMIASVKNKNRQQVKKKIEIYFQNN